MSAALRARYRDWWATQQFIAVQAGDEEWSAAVEGLHFWHRMRIRRMYGCPLF